MIKKNSILIKIIMLIITINATAQNINYAKHSKHTLVLPSSKVNISYAKIMMNDTVDVLKIKESEFGSSSNFDAIGDMDGYEAELQYGLTNKLMINYKKSVQNIDYSSSVLTNTQADIFLRYNLFQHQMAKLNSGLSVDVGFVTNKLQDYYMDDFEVMKNLVKKVDSTIGMVQNNGKTYAKTKDGFGNDIYTPLPYIALKDTKDSSEYIRLLTGYYTKYSVIDFYLGYKKTKIKNLITTTDEIIQMAKDQGYEIEKRLDRDEKSYILGFNITLESKDFVYEFGFEYDKFIRDKGLDYIDFNYIFDLDLSYKYSKQILLFAGAKIMYRQLNGEIPYLYNQYSQTSYDHKYGYARVGIQYSF